MGGHVDRHPAAPGLLITAGCSCLFLLLTTRVLLGGPLERFDQSAAGALHAFASESGGRTRLFRAVGVIGSPEALVVVGALVALALAVWRTWSTLAIWLAAVLGEEALNVRLKALIVPPRPSFDRPLVFETSYSYPSGLAMESLVVYGIFAHLALLTPWGSGRRAVLVCGTAVLVALIGFGRAYLGAHFLSDMAGEFAAGAHGRAPSSPLERQYAGVRRDLHPAPARPPVLRENVPPCATPGAARCRPLGLPVQKPGSGRGGPETLEIRCGKG